MIQRNVLPFADDEYAARINAVRVQMQHVGIEVLLTSTPENICYLTGYHSLGYFTYQLLILSLEHDPILLTRAMNVDKARVDSVLVNIEGYEDTEDPKEATYRVLEHYGFLSKRLGNQDDAWFFSVSHYKNLLQRLGVGALPDCSGLIERVRLIKSPQEIAYIREAGRYCEASLAAAIDAVAPGATDNDVAAAAYQALYKAGSEYLGHAAQFVTGPAAGLAFECSRRRVIQKDDVVYMEAGGTHNRYNCMLSRTVMVGKPDPKWLAMANASRDALNEAKAAIRAGVSSHEVDARARRVMKRAGFGQYFQHRTGYSIGIGLPPDWGEGRLMSINQDVHKPLEPGMCFHLIPDLKITMEGGVVFSESVVVTEDGYEPLSTYSQDIFYA